MSFVKAFCRFLDRISFADLSQGETATVKNAFRDGIGCILAGSVEEPARIVYSLLPKIWGPGDAVVIGTRLTAPATAAAFANGVAGHCLDYDDLNQPMMGHPTAVLVPAILATAAVVSVSGQEAIVSYAVGLELAAKLGRGLNPYHYEQGWHATSTLGTLAAAASAAKLLRLSPQETSWALGIAASEASGLRRNFGSMAKAFHAGHAARCGLTAALLAREGFSSCEDILEGPGGLFSVLAPRPVTEIPPLEQALGAPLELTASGLSVKQYPCCAASHPVLDLVLSLRKEWGARLPRLRRIVCRVHPQVPHIMIHDIPKTPLEGKFSLRYCVATAMIDGAVTLESFSPDAMKREGLEHWWASIVVRPDLDGRDSCYGGIPTRAEVIFEWDDGTSTSACLERPRGTPEDPLPEEVLEKKFEECARRALPEGTLGSVQGKLRALEALPALGELSRDLVPPLP